MTAKKCLICDKSTAGDPVVHETCHDELLNETTYSCTEYELLNETTHSCAECGRDFGEIDVGQIITELRALYLPHCRVTV